MRTSPTVYEVAERAGVSTASVSRVLAGHDRVRQETRDKVMAAVTELGYVPRGAAQDLAGRRTAVLGLCFPDLVGDRDIARPGRARPDQEADTDAMYWYDEVIRGMERAARRSGYALLIAASHETDDANLVLTVAGRCDGLVVLAGTAPAETVEHVVARVPVVLLAAPPGIRVRGTVDHLGVANESGMHELTRHLLDTHGYTDLCFIAGPPDSADSASRYAGFRAALAERGLTERGLAAAGEPDLHGDFTAAGGAAVVTRLLQRGPVPRVLVCANDQTAIGAMSALRQAGLRVPEQVAVTGFDGVQVARHLSPGLTTVAQPMREIGEVAVSLLQQRIAESDRPAEEIQLPVRLEVRESCGCPAPAGRREDQ
ncbi:MAG: LacI family DNA-binding transcriptional regulator [Micromonosporaceae bacterium]|nr:LacI family DNA-binding transcriptional regulator [Micromonosporaceae bacterium]